MKLNLGCGVGRRDGYVNIDINPDCKPDALMDIPRESLWRRFGENSVDEIYTSHTLEHLAPFLDVALDMWRVCKAGALWEVIVPHTDFEICNPYHITRFSEWTFRFFEPTPRFRLPSGELIMRGTAHEMNPIMLEEIEQQLCPPSIRFLLRVIK